MNGVVVIVIQYVDYSIIFNSNDDNRENNIGMREGGYIILGIIMMFVNYGP